MLSVCTKPKSDRSLILSLDLYLLFFQWISTNDQFIISLTYHIFLLKNDQKTQLFEKDRVK